MDNIGHDYGRSLSAQIPAWAMQSIVPCHLSFVHSQSRRSTSSPGVLGPQTDLYPSTSPVIKPVRLLELSRASAASDGLWHARAGTIFLEFWPLDSTASAVTCYPPGTIRVNLPRRWVTTLDHRLVQCRRFSMQTKAALQQQQQQQQQQVAYQQHPQEDPREDQEMRTHNMLDDIA
ncbi:hypothetical protein ACEPAG_8380 [Sanghuangporus baumii]